MVEKMEITMQHRYHGRNELDGTNKDSLTIFYYYIFKYNSQDK